MKTIPLTRGLFTSVDDDVYEWASKFKWRAQKDCRTFYAVRSIKLPNGKWTMQRLHREILKAPPGACVDHIDGNGLNNVGKNVRICRNPQNVRNSQKSTNNTSGFKGVCWHRRDKKWVAKICAAGRRTYLGYFDDADSAARAYDRAAWKFFGKFAHFNFPRPWLKLN